jgi:acetyl-CoA acetyltransferase
MGRRVNVIGVGMVKFAKPGASEEYNVMASKAARGALADAGVPYGEVEQAYAGYVYGDSTCGQRAVYEVGLTGIPVFNVNNNCSTGSSALMLAKQAIEGGVAECVIAIGFEQMEKGALQAKWTDRTNPLDKHVGVMNDAQGVNQAPFAAQMFGGAGREYRWRYGTKKETFGKIAWKARQHANRNPYALFSDTLTLDEIMAAPLSSGPVTPAEVEFIPEIQPTKPEPVKAAPAPAPAPAPEPVASEESLVSDTTLTSAAAALSALKNIPESTLPPLPPTGLGFRSGTTIEDLVLESLKPMLKEWLDTNLTGIVERLVEKEVRKLSARS